MLNAIAYQKIAGMCVKIKFLGRGDKKRVGRNLFGFRALRQIAPVIDFDYWCYLF